MARARLRIDGLDVFKAALMALPAELRDEAQGIVQSHADAAVGAIGGAYPLGPTGHLRAGLGVSRIAGSHYGVIFKVKNTAKHAWIFENGTELRHTALGRNRGRMPAGKVFIPIVIRERRAMVEDLVALVERAGIKVHGV